jgi:hypothetical protein
VERESIQKVSGSVLKMMLIQRHGAGNCCLVEVEEIESLMNIKVTTCL